MRRNDLAYEVQSEPRAAPLSAADRLGAEEPLEQSLLILLSNADALIRHADLHPVPDSFGDDGDVTTWFGVLDRVGEQVVEHLSHADCIATHDQVVSNCDVDVNLGSLCSRSL